MAADPPAPTLPCKECGFVNEPERVYCHQCGAKLDRSILPKEDQLRREPPERARKRIMRMTNPAENVIKTIVVTLIKTLVLAALAAMLIVAAMPPDDAPKGKPELSSRLVSSEISQLVGSPQPRQLLFTQGELNSFLGSGKVKKESSLPGVTYVRTYVNLEPGIGRVSIERAVCGWPIHIGAIYRTEANQGVFFAENVGGNFGKLPIHPLLMKYASPVLFGDLAASLKPELDSLRKAPYLRIDKQQVILATSGVRR